MPHTVLALEFIPFFLVFCRVVGLFLSMPFLGQLEIPNRFRVMAALAIAFLLTPLLALKVDQPIQFTALLMLIGREFLIGYCVGFVGRLLLTALDVAGDIISMQMGLSSATMMNPSLHSQGALTSFLLSFFGLAIFLSLDLHQLMFRGLVNTYLLFPLENTFPIGDFSHKITVLFSTIFKIGLQFSFPFLIVFIVLQIALGLMNRMIPQMQVFFVAMPFQILGGMVILFLTGGAILLNFGALFDHEFRHFFNMG